MLIMLMLMYQKHLKYNTFTLHFLQSEFTIHFSFIGYYFCVEILATVLPYQIFFCAKKNNIHEKLDIFDIILPKKNTKNNEMWLLFSKYYKPKPLKFPITAAERYIQSLYKSELCICQRVQVKLSILVIPQVITNTLGYRYKTLCTTVYLKKNVW